MVDGRLIGYRFIFSDEDPVAYHITMVQYYASAHANFLKKYASSIRGGFIREVRNKTCRVCCYGKIVNDWVV